MKPRVLLIILPTLFVAMLSASNARADKPKNNNRDQRVEQTISATETVAVALCVTSGDITVHGGDRKEVRARAKNAARIELRRNDLQSSGPASSITVLLSGSGTNFRNGGQDCQVFGDVELEVPRGATVRLRTGDGSVHVTSAASVFVETQSGDVEISEASKVVEAGSLSGALTARNCSGRARLHSVSGNIAAANMKAGEGDDFSASTVSGDISLERIGHQQVAAKTATGQITMHGPLSRGGRYTFGTISGDVSLRLPADASFQVNAKVSPQGDIVTDFPFGVTSGQSPKPAPDTASKKAGTIKGRDYGTRKINGVQGSGDATISLASFSGTLYLRKE